MNSNNEGDTPQQNRIRRKKDPKSMTIEELEDYIKRNKPIGRVTNECRSLNSSFQCMTNFNFNDNMDNSGKRKDKSEEKDRANLSFNYPHIKTESNDINEHKIINSNSILKDLASPFNVNYSKTAKSSKDNGEQFEEKKNETSSSPKKTNIQQHNNPITNLNSKAASGYLKTLQDKINQLSLENDELKRNFISVSELLEKEQEKNSKTLFYESNNTNKSNEFMKQFNNEKEELILKINMQATNISLLEKEKIRHLEQNSVEKAEYEGRIDQLNKKIQLLNRDNDALKKELMQLSETNDEVEKFKKQFETERTEMIETMKSLREIIFQKENEKNSLVNQYEAIIQELNEKIDQLSYSNNMNNSNSQSEIGNSHSGIKKNKTVVNKPRNKTKDKAIPSKLSNNVSNYNNKQMNNNNHYQNSSSSSSSICSNKKPKRLKTPKGKAKSIQKTSIPIKSAANNRQQTSNEMNVNQNMAFKPGELSSIRSDYDFSDSNKYNANNWMSGRDERINDYEEQLNQINESIFSLERNLPEISRDYKNILSRLNSNLFPEETITLKNNLNILGATIEEHNNQLIQLKTQQQDILKDYLSQGRKLN